MRRQGTGGGSRDLAAARALYRRAAAHGNEEAITALEDMDRGGEADDGGGGGGGGGGQPAAGMLLGSSGADTSRR